MPTFKLSYFWKSADDEGWSESFYGTFMDAALAVIAGATLMDELRALRSSVWFIIWSRVSDVAIKGDSTLIPATYPLAGTYAPPAGAVHLEANTALDFTLYATASIKNRVFLRGLTSDVVEGREYLAPTGFATALTTLKTDLTTTPYLARHRTAIGPPPVYSYTAIADAYVARATARKPGRPFGLPAGRRRP